MTTSCPRCNRTAEVDDQFCAECGTDLSSRLQCSRCAALLPESAKFCTGCGKSAAESPKGETTAKTPEGGKGWYSLFPELRKPERAPRKQFWGWLLIACVGSALCAAFAGMIAFEFTKSEVFASLVMSLAGLYFFMRSFAHVYVGRLIDCGLSDNSALKKTSFAVFAATVFGGLISGWVSLLGGLVAIGGFIYVGSKPSVSPSESASSI